MYKCIHMFFSFTRRFLANGKTGAEVHVKQSTEKMYLFYQVKSVKGHDPSPKRCLLYLETAVLMFLIQIFWFADIINSFTVLLP